MERDNKDDISKKYIEETNPSLAEALKTVIKKKIIFPIDVAEIEIATRWNQSKLRSLWDIVYYELVDLGLEENSIDREIMTSITENPNNLDKYSNDVLILRQFVSKYPAILWTLYYSNLSKSIISRLLIILIIGGKLNIIDNSIDKITLKMIKSIRDEDTANFLYNLVKTKKVNVPRIRKYKLEHLNGDVRLGEIWWWIAEGSLNEKTLLDNRGLNNILMRYYDPFLIWSALKHNLISSDSYFGHQIFLTLTRSPNLIKEVLKDSRFDPNVRLTDLIANMDENNKDELQSLIYILDDVRIDNVTPIQMIFLYKQGINSQYSSLIQFLLRHPKFLPPPQFNVLKNNNINIHSFNVLLSYDNYAQHIYPHDIDYLYNIFSIKDNNKIDIAYKILSTYWPPSKDVLDETSKLSPYAKKYIKQYILKV